MRLAENFLRPVAATERNRCGCVPWLQSAASTSGSDLAVRIRRLSSVPTKMLISGGTMANVKSAERARPPMTTEPRPRYSSEPAPGNRTSGSMPKHRGECGHEDWPRAIAGCFNDRLTMLHALFTDKKERLMNQQKLHCSRRCLSGLRIPTASACRAPENEID